jgi:hypothetical protein
MRVTSDLFVSALLRRVFSAGGFAAVERRGAAEAGAVFIRQRRRDGRETLYGPAPQSFFGEGDDQRRFEIRSDSAEPEAAEAIIVREMRFDPDLWLVDLDVEDVTDLIDIAGEEPPAPGDALFR